MSSEVWQRELQNGPRLNQEKKALEEALFLGDMPFYGWN